jgi:hypothetical protein
MLEDIMRGSTYIAVAILLLGVFTDPAFAGRRGARPGGPGQASMQEPRGMALSPEMQREQDEMKAFIIEYFPERARRLEELRKHSPKIFAKRRNEIVEKARHLMRLREEDSKMFHVYIDEIRMRGELDRMSKEWKDLEPKDRKEIEVLILEKLELAFELRQQIKEDEVQKLEIRFNELKESLERRSDKRKQLIEDRFESLTGGQNDEW